MQNTNKVAKDLATALTASLKKITKTQSGITIESKNGGEKFSFSFNSSTTNSSLGRGL